MGTDGVRRGSEQVTVLVVEDDPEVAALYGEWLDDYDLRVAHGGREALETLEQEPVDVVLLDRRMDGISGDEVLDAIRRRGHDCRAAMVTAVDPGFEVVDMPFDDYLTKPVSEADLRETVTGLVALEAYSDLQLELSSKRVRRSVLRGEKRRSELAASDEFERLESEIEALEAELAEIESAHPAYEPLFERIR
ncbi:MAG: response regulator transcription factor [Haloferacaceae archaeon]